MISSRQFKALCVAGSCMAWPSPMHAGSGSTPDSGGIEPTRQVERRPVLMGTVTRIVVVAGTREDALATTAKIEQTLRSTEDELSTWKAGTELDRFNRTAIGRAVELPPRLDAELLRALDCAEATGGTFDPTVGALTRAWDLRGQGRQPREDELNEARRRSGWRLLSRDDSAWTRHRNIIVDEGGFAKGAALDRVRRQLDSMPPRRVLIDLGGQFLLFDSHKDPEPWPLAVADPDDRSMPVLRLIVSGGSVATSANSERSVKAGGATIGHLLDPRTGSPAHDFGSVTVWAPSGLDADCLATGLFVAGPDAAIEFAARHRDVEVVVLERHGSRLEARVSEGLRERVEVISQRLSLRSATTNPDPSRGADRSAGESSRRSVKTDANTGATP